MTETALPSYENMFGSLAERSGTAVPETSQSSSAVRTLKGLHLLRTTKRNSTSTGTDESLANIDDARPPVERFYPHIFDEAGSAGQARLLIISALSDAQKALEAFGHAELDVVGTQLALIATTMSKAHRLSDFNESLGAVISFVRRATLVASSADISRSALNILIHALRTISENPMLALDEAADIVDKLSGEGWRGEHGIADAIVSALFGDESTEDDSEEQFRIFEDASTDTE